MKQEFETYTDEELWIAIKASNEKAFDDLFHRYWKKMHLFVLSKTGSVEATGDIVQDLFTSLWERRNEVDIRSLSAYLYTAAKYLCINYIKAQIASRKHWTFYQRFVSFTEESTSRMAEFNILLEEFEKSLNQLPEKSKQIFRKSRFEGKSTSELARLFNVSEKTIEYHISQSLRHLRTNLRDYHLFIVLCLLR